MTESFSELFNELLEGATVGNLTEKYLELAAQLPPGYLLTETRAFEAGPSAGLEGGLTKIYSPTGQIYHMVHGGVAAGMGLPVSGVLELGIAYVGDGGPEKLAGVSISVEGGELVGGGLSTPWDQAGNFDFGIVSALLSRDYKQVIRALADQPEGTTLFVSGGIQGDLGIEITYAHLFPYGGRSFPTQYDGSDYWKGFDTAMEVGVPVDVIWPVDDGDGGALYVTQRISPAGDRRDGTAFDGSLRDGKAFVIRTTIIDETGRELTNSEVGALGLSPVKVGILWKDGTGPSEGTSFEWIESCFAAGSEILLWPEGQNMEGRARPIEDIVPGDIVLSYDADGNLVPGRVTRLFRNEAEHILDVHGLMVTPGHVTLCGDGPFAGRHVPIIDILVSDGALVRTDGSLMRMAIDMPVGCLEDQFVELACARTAGDARSGALLAARVRVGTLLHGPEGEPVSILERIHGAGMSFDPETGLVATPGAAPAPLRWFGAPPRPEDYILARSGLTMAELRAAAIAESAPAYAQASMIH